MIDDSTFSASGPGLGLMLFGVIFLVWFIGFCFHKQRRCWQPRPDLWLTGEGAPTGDRRQG